MTLIQNTLKSLAQALPLQNITIQVRAYLRGWKPKEPSLSHRGPEAQRRAATAMTASGPMNKTVKLKTDKARPEWTVARQKDECDNAAWALWHLFQPTGAV